MNDQAHPRRHGRRLPRLLPVQAVTLPRVARVLLITCVALILGGALVDVTWPLIDTPVSVLRTVLLCVAVGMFAWLPRAASLLLMAFAAFALLTPLPGPTLAMTASASLLVCATCPIGLAGIYVLAQSVLIGLNALASSQSRIGDALPPLVFLAITATLGSVLRFILVQRHEALEEVQQLKAKRASLIADERNRIADDLHDIVGHELTQIQMHTHVLRSRLDTFDPSLRPSIDAIAEASAQALSDVRRVIAGTSASSAATDNLRLAIDTAAHELQTQGFAVERQVEQHLHLPPLLETTLCRGLHEATTNVMKYGDPNSPVMLALSSQESDVALQVSNKVDVTATRPRHSSLRGIERLAERAHQLGGSCTVRSQNGWWSLALVFPLRVSSSAEHGTIA